MHIEEMIEEFKNLRSEINELNLGNDSLEKELELKIDKTLNKMTMEDLQNFAREVHQGLDNLGVGIGFSMHRVFEDKLKKELTGKKYSSVTEAIENNDLEIIKSFIKILLKAILSI